MKAIRDVIAILICLFGLTGAVGIISGKIDKNLTALVFCGIVFVYLIVKMLWDRSKREHPLLRGPSDLDFSKARERKMQSNTSPERSKDAPSKIDDKAAKRKREWEKLAKDKFLRRRAADEEEDKK